MELTAIYRYPVKSLAGDAPTSIHIDARGLHRDRHWMVVNADGRFLTQREHPRMCLITAELQGDDTLTLSAPDATPLKVEPSAQAPRQVVVWDDTVDAVGCAEEADLWLSDYLDTDCHLVRLTEASRRSVNPQFALPDDQVGFADGFPFLLISRASLADLCERRGQTLSMLRFRPNLVVDGCDAFAEDSWNHMRIGDITFRVAKPCVRCAIPTLDPITGERDPLVMRTLLGYRRHEGRVIFGQNLLHDGPGTLRTGMSVELLD